MIEFEVDKWYYLYDTTMDYKFSVHILLLSQQCISKNIVIKLQIKLSIKERNFSIFQLNVFIYIIIY